MNYKAIIFDWHGVLDETKLEHLKNKLVSLSKKSPEEVGSILKTYERPYGNGDVTRAEFWSNIRKAFHFGDVQLYEAQQSILVFRKYIPLWDLLPKLRTKYTLAILSDCPLDKVEIIRRDADLSYFQVVYFSAEKHLTKDSEDFFKNLVGELGVKPAECLYIDDNSKHINTASRLGFQTCLFKTIKDLETMI